MSYDIQVEKERYQNENYLNVASFLSYREQMINVIRCTDVKSVCEVGIGNGITAAVLRQLQYKVTTVDFDAALRPDVVCSVLELGQRIKEKSDMVLCFEVLEHLNFNDFEQGLQNLAAVSKKYVLLSIPYVGISLKMNLYASIYGERQLTLLKRLPLFWKKHVFSGEHYWEVGKKGYSRKRIREAISRQFKIQKEWLFPYNHSALYFLCEIRTPQQHATI